MEQEQFTALQEQIKSLQEQIATLQHQLLQRETNTVTGELTGIQIERKKRNDEILAEYDKFNGSINAFIKHYNEICENTGKPTIKKSQIYNLINQRDKK